MAQPPESPEHGECAGDFVTKTVSSTQTAECVAGGPRPRRVTGGEWWWGGLGVVVWGRAGWRAGDDGEEDCAVGDARGMNGTGVVGIG